MFQVLENLHSSIGGVGDPHSIVSVDGQSRRQGELTRGVAFAPDREQESARVVEDLEVLELGIDDV